MSLTIFISMLLCLQCVYWVVGRRSARRVRGKEDYFLAGKGVRFFPLMMTFLATQVGGGGILGSAEEAYLFGWPVLLYPLGMALGLILLGCGVGRKLAKFRVSTVAQIFEVAYGSPWLKRAASILSMVSLFMVLVAQIIASHKFLVSLGLSHTGLFIAIWAVVMLYTVQGGLRAVISTDIVQAGFFSLVFLLCFGVVLAIEPSTALMQMPQVASFTKVSSKLCGWLLMPLLFMLIEQDMAQRCFAGASARTVSRASFWAGVCTMVICTVPVFLGSLASVAGVEVAQGGSVLMAVVAKTTNPWISALVGCTVLAAILSTATSLINAISSNLSNDFTLSIFRKVDPLRLARGITAIISMGAIFVAFCFNSIVDLLIQSYELSVSCLFVPIVMALFNWEGGRARSALLAMVCGGLGFFLFRIYPIPFPKELASIALSWIGYAIGEVRRRAAIRS